MSTVRGGDCEECTSWIYHKNPAIQAPGWDGVLHQQCGDGYCELPEHEQKWGFLDDRDDFMTVAALSENWEVLSFGDLSEMRALLDQYDNLVLNTDRRAIQLSGCGGSLIASVPLTDAAFAILDEDS